MLVAEVVRHYLLCPSCAAVEVASGTSLFGVRTGLASSLTRAAYRMRSHCFSVIEEPTSRAKRYVRSWLPITRQPT